MDEKNNNIIIHQIVFTFKIVQYNNIAFVETNAV